jgi:hypothetical protein
MGKKTILKFPITLELILSPHKVYRCQNSFSNAKYNFGTTRSSEKGISQRRKIN